MIEQIRNHIQTSCDVKQAFAETEADPILEAAQSMANSISAGGTVYFCGNGGSAADAQHISTELVVRLRAERERAAIPSVALTTNSSILTACGNDYGFDRIFARQVEAHGRDGDILVGISTSGNSENVIQAFEVARERGVRTILLAGRTGGRLKEMADVAILVPSDHTGHIQESHITCGHILCELVEDLLANDSKGTGA